LTYNVYLIDFANGNVIRPEPLPLNDGSEVSIDIHSYDSASLSIPLKKLEPSERNNWKETFAEMRRGCIIANPDVAWNAPGAILPGSGFINKITPDINPHSIELQVTGPLEYTKARIVGEKFTETVTDPTESITYEAGSWENVMHHFIKRMFDNSLIPLNVPKNPNILGNVGGTDGTGRSKTVYITDAKTYGDVLKEISETDSGLGIEYRFVPRWRDETMTSVVWDFVTGVESAPHINVSQNVSLVLDDNEENFSAWDTVIDSNDLYSSLYIQSKAGDEASKSGADFTARSLQAAEFPILVERFFNPGVELTEDERNAQAASRLAFAGKSKYTAGFTVEEQSDPVKWLQRVGCTLIIEGVPDTISAGHSSELRCVGITITLGTGTVSVDVMQKQPIYPLLPKKDLDSQLNPVKPEDVRLPPVSGGGGGGETFTYEVEQIGSQTLSFSTHDNRVLHLDFINGKGGIDWHMAFPDTGENFRTITWEAGGDFSDDTLTVWWTDGAGTELHKGTYPLKGAAGAPDAGWSNDGVFNNADLWGAEGRNPDDGKPQAIKNLLWQNLKAIEYDFSDSPGIWPIDVTTLTQDKGNRLYGLSMAAYGAASEYYTDGTAPRHYQGGVNKATGEPLNGWPSLYIKKTFMKQNGELGTLATVGEITPAMLKEYSAEWEDQAYETIGLYSSGWIFSNWIGGDDRYYLMLVNIYDHANLVRQSVGYCPPTTKYIYNAKRTLLSRKINMSNGEFTGDWKKETNLPKYGFVPMTQSITRYGTTCVFNQGIMVLEEKMKNVINQDWDNWAGINNVMEGYYPPTPRQDGVLGISAPLVSNSLVDSNLSNASWPADNYYTFNRMDLGSPQYKNYEDSSEYKVYKGSTAANPDILQETSGAATAYEGLLLAPHKVAKVEPKSVTRETEWKAINPDGYADVAIAAPISGWIYMRGQYPKSTITGSVCVRAEDLKNSPVPNEKCVIFGGGILGDFSFANGGEYVGRLSLSSFTLSTTSLVSSDKRTLGQIEAKASKVFSYDSKLFQFAHSDLKKIVMRSIEAVENPNP
jgi:hypothetical protein